MGACRKKLLKYVILEKNSEKTFRQENVASVALCWQIYGSIENDKSVWKNTIFISKLL